MEMVLIAVIGIGFLLLQQQKDTKKETNNGSGTTTPPDDGKKAVDAVIKAADGAVKKMIEDAIKAARGAIPSLPDGNTGGGTGTPPRLPDVNPSSYHTPDWNPDPNAGLGGNPIPGTGGSGADGRGFGSTENIPPEYGTITGGVGATGTTTASTTGAGALPAGALPTGLGIGLVFAVPIVLSIGISIYQEVEVRNRIKAIEGALADSLWPPNEQLLEEYGKLADGGYINANQPWFDRQRIRARATVTMELDGLQNLVNTQSVSLWGSIIGQFNPPTETPDPVIPNAQYATQSDYPPSPEITYDTGSKTGTVTTFRAADNDGEIYATYEQGAALYLNLLGRPTEFTPDNFWWKEMAYTELQAALMGSQEYIALSEFRGGDAIYMMMLGRHASDWSINNYWWKGMTSAQIQTSIAGSAEYQNRMAAIRVNAAIAGF